MSGFWHQGVVQDRVQASELHHRVWDLGFIRFRLDFKWRNGVYERGATSLEKHRLMESSFWGVFLEIRVIPSSATLLDTELSRGPCSQIVYTLAC